MIRHPVIVRNPEIMGGMPVFAGTRVPIVSLIDYLEGGYSLAEFLDEFPSVEKEQAVELLEAVKRALLGETDEDSAG